MPRRARALLVLYGALALLVVPVFPHFLSPNEFARWATAASLVERGTPEVSAVRSLLGPLFEDLSSRRRTRLLEQGSGARVRRAAGLPPRAPRRRPSLARGDADRPRRDAPRRRDPPGPSPGSSRCESGGTLRGGRAADIRRRLRASLRDAALRLRAPPLLARPRRGGAFRGLGGALHAGGAARGDPPRGRGRRPSRHGCRRPSIPAAVPAAVLSLCATWRRGPGRPLRIAAGAAPFARRAPGVQQVLLWRVLRALLGARGFRASSRPPSSRALRDRAAVA